MNIEFLSSKFAYFTECNLATLEGMRLRKSTSRYDLSRQQNICNDMVSVCKELNADCKHLPRLKELLK
jgi:hypothetical protein